MFRLRFGFVLIAMVLSVFGARLVQLQGIDPNSYAAMAAAEGVEEITLPAERGEILDRDGAPLARSVHGMMIVADPTMTEEHAADIADVLAQRLDVDYVETLHRLRKPDTRFVYLARRVPATLASEVMAALDEHGYDGVSTRKDPIREYPADDVAANLLGFMGADGEPLAGLELTFDDLLSGTDGSARYEVADGNRIPLGESTVVEPQDGEDLQLTIDRDVQWFTQRVLRNTVEGARGESGVAIVMDSRSGEVLALADYPTFNADEPLASPAADYGSRAISDVYEPGSVQKVLTVAALLDAGEVTPRTPIVVPPELPRADRIINDYWDHGRLRLTMTGVIAKSSNIGTVLAADEFEPRELHDYLAQFGLGSRTGIGVRGESAGLLPPATEWTQLRQDTIAFGQGLSVNAMQMTAAINTIANGGLRIDPSLVVGRATDGDGDAVGTATAEAERVVSAEAARQTARMMEMVVDSEEGTAPAARVPGYRVAGKTGTAQRVGEECNCYDGTYTVSFAGFAPADDPRFTVYVMVQNPRNGGGGGSVAGPAFSTIMGHVLRKYGVPPTGTKPADLPVTW